jgi:aldo/keto reductase family protein
MSGATPDEVRRAARDTFAVAPSRLGFGCASLGSRIAPSAGLDALAAAYDAGINWFDVAPPYGAGEAEGLLAEFLRGRRDRVIIVTKVGMAPPRRLALLKAAYALGRPLVGAASGLRRGFRSLSATRNRRLALSANLIARSIEGSLKRLGVDHVDVFALHDPDPADVAREEIRSALERVRARGLARRIAVAGGLAACRAALEIGEPYTLLQTSVESQTLGGASFGGAATMLTTHSVFGVGGGALGRLSAALASEPEHMRALVAAGYDPRIERAACDLLVDRALALNPRGVVLASMFAPRHLIANLARARRPLATEAPRLVERILKSS